MKHGYMKQAWLLGKGGPWEVREVPIPTPGPEELLVKVVATSICNQTDLNSIRAIHPVHDQQMLGMVPHEVRIWDKRVPDALSDVYPSAKYPREPFPTTMGHEGVGVVAAIGPCSESVEAGLDEFTAGCEVSVGTRVVGIPIVGGMGEYILAKKSRWLPIPDNISDIEATFIEPTLMVNNACCQVVSAGDIVVVIGQGCLGLLATQIAKIQGARKIIAVEPLEHKRKLALDLGADIAIDPNNCGGNIVDAILAATDGRGADCALEVAGEIDSVRYLPYIMRRGGSIGQIGALCDPVLIDWGYIHFYGLKVVGSSYMLNNGNFSKLMERAILLISSGLINVKPMISKVYNGLDVKNIEEAFENISRGDPIKVIFQMK